jgi:Right handed beta helix region
LSSRQRAHKEKRRRKRQLAAAAGMTASAAVVGAPAAQAAVFPVTTLADTGPGSLRQAITDANGALGSDTITFASGLTGTISLATDFPDITQPLTIQGPGAGVITVNGGGDGTLTGSHHRIFYGNLPGATDQVTVSGLTVTGGGNETGGCIGSKRELTLSGVVLTKCVAIAGAGAAASTLHMSSSTISGNTAAIGGGFYAAAGEIAGSTVSGNTATSFYPSLSAAGGGGIAVPPPPRTMRIENTTISGNVTANTRGAADPGNHVAYAGGLYIPSSQVTVVGSTIAGNKVTVADPAAVGGGGGLTGGSSSAPLIENTIIAGNSAPTGPDVFRGIGASFDLVQNPAGATINQVVPNSTITGADPQLGPLASNGGPTQTMALPVTSPALDMGAAFGLSTDQRGLSRPLDFPQFPNSPAAGADGSDIGAFELQPASGAFSFGKLKRKKRKGTAKQTIKLPTPDLGMVTVSGKGLKTKTVQASSADGRVTLPVTPKGKLRKKLKRRGKAKVTEKVAYTPQGGTPVTETKKVKLLRRLHR